MKIKHAHLYRPQRSELRVIEKDGKVWFCLSDVCKALELNNPSKVKTRLDSGGLTSSEVSTLLKNQYGEFTRTQTFTFIDESNLYRCIFQSKKAEAKVFQDWVFDDVLPQIRRTGGYIPVNADDDEKTILCKAIQILQRTVEEKNERRKNDKQGDFVTEKEGRQLYLNLDCWFEKK